jgi:DNA invertase Pin-like site-specific DNA recombinase
MESFQSSVFRVVSYSRVSTNDQLKSDVTIKASLADQQASAEQIASERGWQFAGHYTDPGVSGEELEERAELQRLLADARAGKFDIVICRHSDRLGRLSYILHYIYHKLEVECKVQIFNANNPPVIVPKAEYSPRRDNSRVFRRGLETLIVESESNDRAKRLEAGRVTQIRAGRFIWTDAPFGYVIEIRIVDGKLDRIPTPNPATYAILELLPGWLLAEKASLKEITARLTRMGVPPPQSQTWYKSTVQRIFRNSFYAGKTAYRRTIEIRDKTGKKRRIKNPDPSKIEYSSHTVPHPWTWETYQAIQRLLTERTFVPPRTATGLNPIPTWLLKCAHCQGAMYLHRTGPARTPFYTCAAHLTNPALCKPHRAPADYVLGLMWVKVDETWQELNRLGPEQYYQSHHHEQQSRLVRTLERQVTNLETKLAQELPAKKDRLNRDYLAGKIEAQDRASLLFLLVQEQDEAKKQLEDMRLELSNAMSQSRQEGQHLEAMEQWTIYREKILDTPIRQWAREWIKPIQHILTVLYEKIAVYSVNHSPRPNGPGKWEVSLDCIPKELV